MRKMLQIDTGLGWQNLSSEFYAAGDEKAEMKAQFKMEEAMAKWPYVYTPYREAKFQIIDSLN